MPAPNPRRGRPKLGPGRGREGRVVSIWASQAQYARLLEYCRTRGLNRNAALLAYLAPLLGPP